jgi:putative ABC transport system permease protein
MASVSGPTSGLGTRLRLTLRRLTSEWRHTLGVVLIIGMGIGPAAVGLTVLDRVLLQPLGYSEPDRIGVVRIDVGEFENHPGLDQNEILDLRDTEGIFRAVEWAIFSVPSLDTGEEVIPVRSAGVSPGLFETLGVPPLLGRSFRPEDLSALVVILSHHIWQTDFGGDPEIIGRSVTFGGRSHEVLGVLPPDFRFRLGRGSYAPAVIDVWRLVRAVRGRAPEQGFLWGWNALVRLEDGVSFEQANASLEAFARRQRETYPTVYGDSPVRFTVVPLLTDLVREAKPAIVAALAGVLLLLATAIVNASALVVVGLRRREQEMAVRSALGAPRRTQITDVVFESLALSVVGGAVGGGLAVWGIAGLRAVIPREVPRWEHITPDWRAVALSACVASLALLITGAVAAWRQTRGTPWKSLGAGSDRTSTPRAPGQWVLVGSQMVVAVVLLFGALQLTRSAGELARTDLGFEPRNVIAFEVPLYGAGLSRAEENRRYGRIRDRLEQLPGVVSVGAISSPPLSGRGTVNNFTANVERAGAVRDEQAANFYAVLPGYLEAMRIPLLQGRDFTNAENAEGLPVAIIDETLARTAFPGQDPIGQRIGVSVPGGGRSPRLPDQRIVGVAAHARVIDPTRTIRPQIYLPFGLWRWAPLYATVRTEGEPRSVMPAVRAVVDELGVGFPVSQVQVLSDNLSEATSVLRAVTILVVVLALAAAFLAAFGLYAVVSSVVLQQRRAMAIRSVLGASRGRLLRLQFRRVGLILVFAAPTGVALSLAGARLLESLVYGVALRDAGSLVGATALGVVAGLLATYIPARRAAKADPLVALKVE